MLNYKIIKILVYTKNKLPVFIQGKALAVPGIYPELENFEFRSFQVQFSLTACKSDIHLVLRPFLGEKLRA